MIVSHMTAAIDMLKKKPVKVDGFCINKEQAARLASLRQCSVSQAAEVAVALYCAGPEDEYFKKKCAKHIPNAAATIAREHKSEFLETIEVAGQTIYLTHLKKVIQHYCDSSSVFLKAIKDAGGHGHPVLNLLVYIDETTAGNPLNPINTRKSHLIYVTFLEFGARLCMEDFWLVAGLVTTEKASKLPGGLSQLMRHVLLHWVASPEGILQPAGFAVVLDNQPVLLRFQLYGLVSDESALKQVLMSKGAAGMKPCLRCMNVISKYHGQTLGLEPDEIIRDIAEPDPSKFVRLTDEQVFEIMSKLEHAREHSSSKDLETKSVWFQCLS